MNLIRRRKCGEMSKLSISVRCLPCQLSVLTVSSSINVSCQYMQHWSVPHSHLCTANVSYLAIIHAGAGQVNVSCNIIGQYHLLTPVIQQTFTANRNIAGQSHTYIAANVSYLTISLAGTEQVNVSCKQQHHW